LVFRPSPRKSGARKNWCSEKGASSLKLRVFTKPENQNGTREGTVYRDGRGANNGS
jgi:hypothetical protein